MSYIKSRRRASLGLWDPRHAGQTMPEPVINRAYIPGLAYASGVPGTIDSEPNTMQGLGDCLGCGHPQGLLRGLGAVKKGGKKAAAKVGLHIPVILPPAPIVPVVPPDNAPAPAPAPAPDANVPAVVPDGVPGPYAAESKAPYYWGLGVGLLLGGLVGYKLGSKKRPA